ncbi:MAG: YegS/Rv2252/BmrU family lipid kinase [Oscillospiraceae bacterium]|nr:YegS/Rv2252/BmrU family lipid kinase [Oscillospiraceae bacterium]
MSKKILFIFNPHSGKGRIKTFLFDIVDIFTKADFEVTVYPTQNPGDCTERVSRLDDDFDIIAVSGGDGTLKEAVSGMVTLSPEKRRPIGYIPSGTMNDFASGNGIPKVMTDAAEAIISGRKVRYDIGSFNSNSFIYVAAFGAFTDVPYDTPQYVKTLFGPVAYFLEGIKRLPKLKGIHVKIDTYEGETVEEDVLICLIMNSTRVAGFEISEFYDDIDTDDGIFEIVLIPKTDNILDVASVITNIKNGERDKDGTRVISTKGARITTDEPARWTLDGEFGGEETTVDFEVVHDAVEFIIK